MSDQFPFRVVLPGDWRYFRTMAEAKEYQEGWDNGVDAPPPIQTWDTEKQAWPKE